MSEAVPQPALTGADQDMLAALRFGWGEAYRIGWDPVRGWWATRRDGEGDDITGGDHDALWDGICEDYTRKPVPRDTDAGQETVS